MSGVGRLTMNGVDRLTMNGWAHRPFTLGLLQGGPWFDGLTTNGSAGSP